MTPPELALVIPCYNEADRLDPDAYLQFVATHPAVHLLLMDDGSGDGTWAVLERIRAAAPQAVTTHRHTPNRGKAETVRVGMLAGMALHAPLVGFFDADLSTPLETVDDFLTVLGNRPEIEFVLGSRVMLMGRDIRRKAARHYLGRVFATGASFALDLPIYDTQCGAKVLRATPATARIFAQPFRSRWIFDVELIARYLALPVASGEPARRDRLYELVLPQWHDKAGSKVRWYDFARAMVELGYIWRDRVVSRRRDDQALAAAGAAQRFSRAPGARIHARPGDRPADQERTAGAGEHTMSNDEKQPPTQVSRRQFVGTVATTAAGLTIVPRHVLGAGFQAPSDTVNVAIVGYIHGMGTANLINVVKTDNIVALCDLDESAAAKEALKRRGTLEKLPKAVLHKDFRAMLDKQKDIDAVLVATPDHTHAVIAMAAMQLGKHVYVQKPLTRTVSEARALTEAARKYKVVTQMGNQGHSEEGLRLMQEWFDAGALGQVKEVHCWTNRPIWPQGMPRPSEQMNPPDGLDWENWIGPSPMRPFHKTYHPFGWRAWQDFGAGAMGDMGCHVMDAAFTVLKLGYPDSVIATLAYNFLPPAPGQRGFGQRVEYNDSYPPAALIHLTFPARGNLAPVKLHWYDGGLLPELPDDLEAGRKLPESGTIFVGEKGKMMCETYSESPRLIPESFMQSFQRPAKTLPRVPEGRSGHERNWLDSIRQKGQAVSNFDYAGPFTEAVLLGNVALRFPGQRLAWDGQAMKVTNVPEANQYVTHQYRPGWSL